MRYPRAHGKPAGTKNIRPGSKKHVKLHTPTHMSEREMNRHMEGLEGEHRSIYPDPYLRGAKGRERRLHNKPL